MALSRFTARGGLSALFRTAAVGARQTDLARAFSAGGGGIPTDEEHAVGLEALELKAEREGKAFFEPHMVGPFGTKENPVICESIYSERIIGCPGNCASPNGTETHNEVRWFMVRETEPTVCPHCDQVFALKRVEPVTVTEGIRAPH